MKDIKEKIVTFIFILTVAVLFFGIFVQYVYNHYPVNRLISVTGEKNIDWEEQYPFEEKDMSTETKNPSRLASVRLQIAEFSDKIKDAESLIEDAVNVNFPFRTKLIEAGGRVMKIVGIRKFPGPTVDIGDDHLVLLIEEKDTKEAAEMVNDFKDFLCGRDIGFMQVIAPSKVVPGETNLFGYKDYADPNTDHYIKRLAGDMDVLDLRTEMNKDFGTEGHCDLFFRTDHHWLYSTGLWAAKKTAERLDVDFDFDIPEDIFDPDAYRTETYDRWLLGSLGKKVTTGYIEPDDLEIPLPIRDTAFRISIPSLDIEAEGDFYDTMIYHKILTERHYYDWDAYWALGYGDRALIQVDNLDIKDGKKMLIVKDSFANSLWPYLAQGVDEMDIIDMRRFKGSLRTYIDKTGPDVVLFIYSNGSVPEGEPESGMVFYLR